MANEILSEIRKRNQREINVPGPSAGEAGAFGHLLTNARGATALFPDILLVEELVGGQVEGRRARPGGGADRKEEIEIVENPEK